MEKRQTNESADPLELFSAFSREIQELYPRVASNLVVRYRLGKAKDLHKDAQRRGDSAAIAAHAEAVERYQPFTNKKKPSCEATMDYLCAHTRQLLTSLISHYVLTEAWNRIEGATDTRMLVESAVASLQSRNFTRDIKMEMIGFLKKHEIRAYPKKFTPIVEDVIERLRSEIPS